jgi:hypothetical protein
VKAVDVTLDNPMPVKDVLTIGDRSGPKTISVAQLLANDRDWQGDALHIGKLRHAPQQALRTTAQS